MRFRLLQEWCYIRFLSRIVMTYNYKGHEIDIICTLAGYVAYLDGDLEPQDLSEEEFLEIVNNKEE